MRIYTALSSLLCISYVFLASRASRSVVGTCDASHVPTRKVNEYLELVYGSPVPRSVDLCSFHILYKDFLEFTDIRLSWEDRTASSCEERNLLSTRVWLDDARYGMVFHSDRTALPNYTWIEVTHCVRETETGGYWTYHSAGSGVWVNTGRTKAVQQHEDIQSEDLARLDTVQFLRHSDQNCGNSGIEVLFPHYQGKHACGPPMRSGWNASRPCHCHGDSGRLAIPSYGEYTTACARCKE